MKIEVQQYFPVSHQLDAIGLGSNEFGACILDKSENVTFVDRDFRVHAVPYLQPAGKWGKLHSSAILEQPDLLAIAHDDVLTICNSQGESNFECAVDQLVDDDFQPSFGEIAYDCLKNELWTSLSHWNSKYEVIVFDLNSMHVVRRKSFQDPFGNSHICLTPTSVPGTVVMHLDTGGCGDGLYVLRSQRNDIERVDTKNREIHGWCCSPFHNEFLSVSAAGYIERYSIYPFQDQGSFCGLEEGIQLKNGERYISPFIVYLASDHLLAGNDVDIFVYNATTESCEKIEFVVSNEAAAAGMKSGYFTRVFSTRDHVIVTQAEGFFVVPKSDFLKSL